MSVKVIFRAPGRRISLCASPTRKGDKVYQAWQVRESAHGHRPVKRSFSKLEDAEAYAKNRAKLLTGQSASIPVSDLESFRDGVRNLYGTGKTISQATAEYSEAKRELVGFDVALPEVARFYKVHHRIGTCSKSIEEVVEELLERRMKEAVSAAHLRDLDSRLGRFAKDVSCGIGSLTSGIIQTWLDGLKNLSNRTLKNYLAALSNLIGFAKVKGYLPKEFDPLGELEKLKVRRKPIGIFTPMEMLYLLRHASDSVLPVLLLGGFAGLRTSETVLMNWESVDWQKNGIIVPREGKTQERRIPMERNLRAWLEPLKQSGPMVEIPLTAIPQAMERTVIRANRDLARKKISLTLKWKHNGLRHSYVTYQSRIQANPYLVSSWTGHSISTMKRFYCNETVTDESARGWFAIHPDTKTVQLYSLEIESPGETFPESATNGQNARIHQ